MKMITSDSRKPEVNKGAMLFLTFSLILATTATTESTETTATTIPMTTLTTTTYPSSPTAVIESASEATEATTPMTAEAIPATTTTMTTPTTTTDPSSPAAVIESASETTEATTPMAAEAIPATTTTSSSLEEAENETTWTEKTTWAEETTETVAEEKSATLTTPVATPEEIAATAPETTPAETTPSTTTPSTTTTITAATTAAEKSDPMPTSRCTRKGEKDCNRTMIETQYCSGNGRCCQMEHQEPTCQCYSGFEPPRCDTQSMVGVLESHDQALQMTALTSGLSMMIAILALVALIIVTVMLVKRAQSKQQKVIDRAEDLDREILYVQGELAKLSPAEKMTRLTRLSKIVEATARATILICPASQTPGQESGSTNGQVLPRRSSAPCALDRPAGQFSNGSRKDGSSNIEKRSGKPSFIKKTRHQIFSV